MLRALLTLLLCQFLGEIAANALALPLPGPVIGLVLLLALLIARGGADEPMRAASQRLLQYLSLLFVPAGVGILQHLHRVEREWLPIAVSLVVSAVLTVAVTAFTIRALARLTRAGDEERT